MIKNFLHTTHAIIKNAHNLHIQIIKIQDVHIMCNYNKRMSNLNLMKK